jgi:hypothetical protein
MKHSQEYEDLTYNSESLYTPQFINLLKSTLGDPEKFKRLSLKNQKQIQNEIECLVNDENSWSYNVKKGKYTSFDELRYSQEFITEYSNFDDLWLKIVVSASNKGKTNKIRNVYITQINNLIDELLLLVKNNNDIFDLNDKSNNDEEISSKFKGIMDTHIENIKDEFNLLLTSHHFFNLGLLSIYEEVYSKLLNKKDSHLLVTEFVKSYSIEILTENLNKFFVVKFYEIIFFKFNPNYLPEEIDSLNENEKNLNEFRNGARKFLAESKKNENLYILSKMLSNYVFKILEESNVIELSKNTVPNKKGGFMHVYKILKLIGNGIPILKRHLPEITPPEELSKENIYTKAGVYKIIDSGQSNCVFSESAINALNITQQKSYSINYKYVELLEEFDSSKTSLL